MAIPERFTFLEFMKSLIVLPSLVVPSVVNKNVDFLFSISRIAPDRLAQFYEAGPLWKGPINPRIHLEAEAAAYLERALKNQSLRYDGNAQFTRLLFKEVEPHRDDPVFFRGKACMFFHVVTRGRGVLCLPNVRDKAMRRLELRRGTSFLMNPSVLHSVQEVTAGLSSLTAVVLPPEEL